MYVGGGRERGKCVCVGRERIKELGSFTNGN